MKCNLRSEKDLDILELGGEIDLQYSPKLRKQILQSLEHKHALLIDLQSVSYIDSSAIASLVEGLQTAKNAHLPFGLMGAHDAVTQVLALTKLDKVFPMYDSLDEFKSKIEA